MRIGITIRQIDVNNKETFVLYKRYIKYFEEDEVVLILPNQSVDILNLCDAFVITGGDDLNPKLYKQVNTCSNFVNDEIDILDFMVIEHAYLNNKKLLGICRGIQSINVFFNGTLKQHHENHMNVQHFIYRQRSEVVLDVGEELLVNSYHHQIVGKIGDGLIISYVSDDSVIEMLEHINGKIFGVQFHPEIENGKIEYKKIFDILR